MTILSTSRFNNSTWEENCKYREKKGIKGCIYCCPGLLSAKIEPNELVFVIEMNNDVNKIEGIGLIYNAFNYDKRYEVYEVRNYNRYTYIGKYRLDRTNLNQYNPELVKALDYILFKEKTHMKRGAGIKTVPDKLLRHPVCQDIDIKKELKAMFKSHFSAEKKALSENSI
jgi:hypothetical protein